MASEALKCTYSPEVEGLFESGQIFLLIATRLANGVRSMRSPGLRYARVPAATPASRKMRVFVQSGSSVRVGWRLDQARRDPVTILRVRRLARVKHAGRCEALLDLR